MVALTVRSGRLRGSTFVSTSAFISEFSFEVSKNKNDPDFLFTLLLESVPLLTDIVCWFQVSTQKKPSYFHIQAISCYPALALLKTPCASSASWARVRMCVRVTHHLFSWPSKNCSQYSFNQFFFSFHIGHSLPCAWIKEWMSWKGFLPFKTWILLMTKENVNRKTNAHKIDKKDWAECSWGAIIFYHNENRRSWQFVWMCTLGARRVFEEVAFKASTKNKQQQLSVKTGKSGWGRRDRQRNPWGGRRSLVCQEARVSKAERAGANMAFCGPVADEWV